MRTQPLLPGPGPPAPLQAPVAGKACCPSEGLRTGPRRLGSDNSPGPPADPAPYQGRGSQAIWPRSCPGGLTFPAPFQRNPSPRLSRPSPTPASPPAGPSAGTSEEERELAARRPEPACAGGKRTAFPGLRVLGTQHGEGAVTPFSGT